MAWAHGVRLAVETHDDLSSARTLAQLLGYARGSAGAVYDTHHPHRMGERPAEVLQALGHNIRHVHLKDAVRLPGKDEWQLVMMGEGEVPVREALDPARRAPAMTAGCRSSSRGNGTPSSAAPRWPCALRSPS